MSKEEVIKMKGEVIKNMSHGFYKIKLDNGHEILAYLSGKMRKYSISILSGDAVSVEISPYDLSKGRITYRFK